MLRIDRILCPVDFSTNSRRALDHAALLARWYGTELTALHVVPLLPTVFGFPSPVTMAAEPEAMQAVARELTGFVAEAAVLVKATTSVVREGSPAVEILHYAAEHEVDLVVLGTHGRSGFERFMLGSVTEKVVRKAPCPVLTVPRRCEGQPERPVFKRMVCGVDFSAASDRAVEHVFSLAQEADASLTLLHVVDWMADADLARYPQFDADGYRRMVVRDARERMESRVPPDARNWCHLDVRVTSGKPYRELLKLAESEAVDLIVLGAGGSGGLVDRVLFGSTTQHVVRRAVCPVLTVRAESMRAGIADAPPVGATRAPIMSPIHR
jgi:nucleotide-binding universal stress UspA family protein